MTLEIRVVHAAVRENIGHRMTHGFTDAQLALRAARGGTFPVVTRHCRFLKTVMPALVAGILVILLNQLRRGWPGQQARP